MVNFPHTIHNAVSMIKHSLSPHEEEIFLCPGQTFEMHPRPTKINAYNWPVYIWKAVYHSSGRSLFKHRDFTK